MNGDNPGSVWHRKSIDTDLDAPCSDASGEAACRRILEAVGLRRREADVARLRRWLVPRLRALRLPSSAAYAELILSDGPRSRQEREHLMREFSSGETYFFRDQDLFARLAESVLPDLLARRAAQRSLRIWSAGCASGEETYSLAMVLDEMGPRFVGWDVRIVGSDINGDAIERARTGIYGEWSFRALDAQRTERYFRKCRRGRQVVERLRAMVRFERGDLLRDGPPDGGVGFDLVLCRNVFIYLSAPAVARIVAILSSALDEGGYLVAGHSELLGCATPGLALQAFPEALVYRKEDPTPALPAASTAVQEPAAQPALTAATGDRRPEVLPLPAPRQANRPLDAARPAGSPPYDVEAALAQAWRDADRGATDAARAACTRMLVTAPFDPRPYYLLAQLAQERGAIDEARALLRQVLYLDPRFVMARLELADLCDRLGEMASARRMREQARRELEGLPPNSVLPVPPRTTAGALLDAVRAAGADQRSRYA